MTSIAKYLQEAHPGYAYQMLQMQIAVEDEKLNVKPTINDITKLIELYMIGVQVLQSISDHRFTYFHNKIHSLMMKKHIAQQLNVASKQVQSPKATIDAVNKAQMQGKRDQYEVNCFFNQGQMDLKKVKQMLTMAQNKKIQVEVKITTDLKKQQDRLDQRLKQRKMRSDAGSVKKFKINDAPSPNPKKDHEKDPRMEYFDLPSLNKSQAIRTSSLQKKAIHKKLGYGDNYYDDA